MSVVSKLSDTWEIGMKRFQVLFQFSAGRDIVLRGIFHHSVVAEENMVNFVQ